MLLNEKQQYKVTERYMHAQFKDKLDKVSSTKKTNVLNIIKNVGDGITAS